MQRHAIMFRTAATAVLSVWMAGAVHAADRRPGFDDGFETRKEVDGAQASVPKVVHGQHTGEILGRFHGTVDVVDTPWDKGLAFRNLGHLRYTPTKLVNIHGGEISLKVRLDFDPNVKNERTKTVLRNQRFLSFEVPGGRQRAFLYTTLTDIAFIVYEGRDYIFHTGGRVAWKQGEWRDVRLTWGREVTIHMDGQKVTSDPWDGIFGTLPEPKGVWLMLGAYKRGDIENEISLDEFSIRTPADQVVSTQARMAVPLVTGAPTMDGDLKDAFWKHSALVTGFVGFADRNMKKKQHRLYAAYTDKGLYLAFDATLPFPGMPLAQLTGRDSNVFTEDALEIRLQEQRGAPVHTLITSAAGIRFDAVGLPGEPADPLYNPDWQVASKMQSGGWTAEMFIPFAEMKLKAPPKPGTVWRGNFCVDSPHGYSHAAVWSYTGDDFTVPMYFGDILFTGSARAMRLESMENVFSGRPALGFRMTGPYPPLVTIRGNIYNQHGASVLDFEYPLRDTHNTVMQSDFLQPGAHTARVNATDENGLVLWRQTLPFEPDLSMQLAIENFPYAGHGKATLRAPMLADNAKKALGRVVNEHASAVRTFEIAALEKGAGTAQFETDSLAPGTYTVEVEAQDAAGKALDSVKRELRLFPKPSWWKNDLGIDHSVPPPWTPVARSADGLSVWGRDYQFAGKSFPKQIASQGKDVFAAKPRLLLQADGLNDEVDLFAAPANVAQTHPDVVTLAAKQDAGAFRFESRGALEFDGCFRYDWTLTPKRAATIRRLVMELPITEQQARFILVSTGASGTVSRLDKDMTLGFVPYFWIGNDDQGCAFFFESAQHWQPHDKRMISIVRKGEQVLLRYEIVRTPLKTDKPVRYTFGLQATPVKDLGPNDPFRYTQWSARAGTVIRTERLAFPDGQKLSFPGTVEFFMKRPKAESLHTDVLTVRGPDGQGLHMLMWRLGRLELRTGNRSPEACKNMIAYTDKRYAPDEWRHVALVADTDEVRAYVDGDRAMAAPMTDELRSILEGAAGKKGELFIGSWHEFRGQTAIHVDDLRISDVARYTGERITIPTSPMVRDAHTVLLDPFEETFRPDDMNAHTAAGTRPTIGCRFIDAGRSGRAVALISPAPRETWDVLEEMKNEVTLIWNWPRYMQASHQTAWPPQLFQKDYSDLLKAAVAEHRKRGYATMPYYGFPTVGGPSDLLSQFADEWGVQPKKVLPYPPPEGHFMHYVSYSAKGYADYMTAGAQWLMDEIGFDSLYTDGSGQVYSSSNAAHGCGWTDANGNRQVTWPFFATREALKRMYRVVKARYPTKSVIVNHVSYNIIAPVMAFSDVVYTGEHEDYENTLTARIRFRGEPLGLYTVLLGTSAAGCEPLHLGVGLLHGTHIWGEGVRGRHDMARKFLHVREAYERFGYKTAKWVVHMKAEGVYWTAPDPSVRVSVYVHQGRDALLVIRNREGEKKTAAVDLKLDAFGLVGKTLTATDALTEVPLALTADGQLSVPLQPKSFVLVHLK